MEEIYSSLLFNVVMDEFIKKGSPGYEFHLGHKDISIHCYEKDLGTLVPMSYTTGEQYNIKRNYWKNHQNEMKII